MHPEQKWRRKPKPFQQHLDRSGETLSTHLGGSETEEERIQRIISEFSAFATGFFADVSTIEEISQKFLKNFPYYMAQAQSRLDIPTMLRQRSISCCNAAILLGIWAGNLGKNSTFVLETAEGINDFNQHCYVKIYEPEGNWQALSYYPKKGVLVADPDQYPYPYANPDLALEQFIMNRLLHYRIS